MFAASLLPPAIMTDHEIEMPSNTRITIEAEEIDLNDLVTLIRARYPLAPLSEMAPGLFLQWGRGPGSVAIRDEPALGAAVRIGNTFGVRTRFKDRGLIGFDVFDNRRVLNSGPFLVEVQLRDRGDVFDTATLYLSADINEINVPDEIHVRGAALVLQDGSSIDCRVTGIDHEYAPGPNGVALRLQLAEPVRLDSVRALRAKVVCLQSVARQPVVVRDARTFR
jgi:hypothetical protein